MKKVFLMMTMLLLAVTAVFCQDESVKDVLVSLGISPALASVIAVVLIFAIGNLAIPNKWASLFLYVEKVFYGLYVLLHKLNEKTNVESKKQKARRLAKVAMIAMFFSLPVSVSAQGGGFFKPLTADIVNEKITQREVRLRDEGQILPSESAWIFRPSASVTAVAVDFSTKPVTTRSLSSIGVGVSYGKFSVIEDKDYCNYSVNALLLTGVVLNAEMSTSVGGALTFDVFNKLLGFGVGYLDKSVMLLTTISYSF